MSAADSGSTSAGCGDNAAIDGNITARRSLVSAANPG